MTQQKMLVILSEARSAKSKDLNRRIPEPVLLSAAKDLQFTSSRAEGASSLVCHPERSEGSAVQRCFPTTKMGAPSFAHFAKGGRIKSIVLNQPNQ
jgi:hypothetical protein